MGQGQGMCCCAAGSDAPSAKTIDQLPLSARNHYEKSPVAATGREPECEPNSSTGAVRASQFERSNSDEFDCVAPPPTGEPVKAPAPAKAQAAPAFDRDPEGTPNFGKDMVELAYIKANGGTSNGVEYKFKSGNAYKGAWSGGMRDGYGKMTWTDGSTYEGQWEANGAVGIGRLVYPSGEIFIGQWSDGKANGYGAHYAKDQVAVCRSQWRNDVQNGCGVDQEAGGAEYRGDFDMGAKTGFGTYIWADGSQVDGNWANHYVQGPGVHTGVDGRVYKGQWENSIMSGMGSYNYPNGLKHEGLYAADAKNGFGIMAWPDGRKYEGGWKEGKQHGAGTFTGKDGRQTKAEWIEGALKQ